ncbi:MAG: hypothetical protein EXQ85_07985 [Alphaproteobacteria bacterium]|nr:hypothetical protein [Alphaproteobacteria bacterium]
MARKASSDPTADRAASPHSETSARPVAAPAIVRQVGRASPVPAPPLPIPVDTRAAILSAPIEPLPLALVLFAALLHAAWNALIKISQDRFSAASLVIVACGVLAVPLAFVVPFPPAAAWPFLAVSFVLHVAYVWFLSRAYTHGDLGHVYPIARGLGPLLLVVATMPLVGERLDPRQLVGALAICLGISSLAWSHRGRLRSHPRALLYAVGTGLFIAAYTYVDGTGTRVVGEPLTYIT